MKKGTLIIWLIILGFIALVIVQNKAFYIESKSSIFLNLGITQPYQSPELPNAVFFLIFFFSGAIIAYLFGLSARFKSKRSLKKLNLTIASHLNQMAELKNEINTLKGVEPQVDELAKTTMLDVSTSKKLDANDTDKSSDAETTKFNPDDTAANPGADDTGESLIKEKE